MKKGKTIHDDRYQTLVRELTDERVRLGVSQSELAEQVGLSQSDISKIEKYERRIDVLEFSLILAALRVQSNPSLQRLAFDFFGLSK